METRAAAIPASLPLPTVAPRFPRCSGLGLEAAEDRHGVSSAQPHSPRGGGLLGKGSPCFCRGARGQGHCQDLPVLG